MAVESDNRALTHELSALLAEGGLVTEGPDLRLATTDGTEARGFRGSCDALALPSTPEEVAAVVAWCYEHDVPVIPRGGGTGLAGGAVPDGGVVVSLERLDRVRRIDPERWRMNAEAGVRTSRIHRVSRENGLLFPPDPGAAEQSTLGGNIATNAGGPHAFKYGVTGSWVTGLEVVLPPGEVVEVGGPIRKDVSGYDLLHLLIGSEGTLGIVTSAWLRLIPAPETRAVVYAFYKSIKAGCEAVAAVTANGIEASVMEYLEGRALAASIGSFPFDTPADPAFAVICEVDGSETEVDRVSAELAEVLATCAVGPAVRLTKRGEVKKLWAWRDGVSIAVTTQRGGKISEDIVVPLDRLAEAIDGTVEIGRRHDLDACSWGHAGDGNVHASFLVSLDDPDELARAETAAGEVFEMTIALGGSISGEHGIGSLKTPWVRAALGPSLVAIQASVKEAFDPKCLLNPGKKLAGPVA